MGTLPPAGWYPDPVNQHELRWWDGTRWGPLAPRTNTVPTAAGPWPADRPRANSSWTATPAPSTPALAGREERGMPAAPGHQYDNRSNYNGVRQTKNNTRTMIVVGAAVALALVAAGIAHGLTAYVVVNGGVVPIDLATHTVGELIPIGTSPINAVAASPDGATVYVASGEHAEDARPLTSVPPAGRSRRSMSPKASRRRAFRVPIPVWRSLPMARPCTCSRPGTGPVPGTK
jgi:hypothetical protein